MHIFKKITLITHVVHIHFRNKATIKKCRGANKKKIKIIHTPPLIITLVNILVYIPLDFFSMHILLFLSTSELPCCVLFCNLIFFTQQQKKSFHLNKYISMALFLILKKYFIIWIHDDLFN